MENWSLKKHKNKMDAAGYLLNILYIHMSHILKRSSSIKRILIAFYWFLVSHTGYFANIIIFSYIVRKWTEANYRINFKRIRICSYFYTNTVKISMRKLNFTEQDKKTRRKNEWKWKKNYGFFSFMKM